MSKWIYINDKLPSANGDYLVKFYTKYRPEYDCIELAWRKFVDGKWEPEYYNYKGDGCEIIAWKLDTKCLTKNIINFYKNFDSYHYQDCLEIGESDKDAVEEIENCLLESDKITSMIDELNNIKNEAYLSDSQMETISVIISGLQELI